MYIKLNIVYRNKKKQILKTNIYSMITFVIIAKSRQLKIKNFIAKFVRTTIYVSLASNKNSISICIMTSKLMKEKLKHKKCNKISKKKPNNKY